MVEGALKRIETGGESVMSGFRRRLVSLGVVCLFNSSIGLYWRYRSTGGMCRR